MPAPNEHCDDPDAALMLEAAGGNEQALRMLIEKWQSPLINFFYRSLGSVEQAEDLAQMVFIRVYRAAASYEPQGQVLYLSFSHRPPPAHQ